MRVDLAAQVGMFFVCMLLFNSFFCKVLSESVGTAMKLDGRSEVAETILRTETTKFIMMFDRFFDILNVSNFNSGYKSRK